MSLYVAIDGPDGCGKSTQALLLVEHLRAAGHDAVHLREPGSTEVGENLRRLLLDPATGSLAPLTEALLFTAARHEMRRSELEPALGAGRTVVAERCFLSTLAYQAKAPVDAAAPMTLVRAMTEQALGGCFPDAVFILDVAAEVGETRLGSHDRIEGRGAAHSERVRTAFLELARDEWVGARVGSIEVLDGAAPVEVVHAAIRDRVTACIASRGRAPT